MKELKALEILKYNKNTMIKFINSFDDDCKEDDEYISGNKYIEELDLAINELEELNNRSCIKCNTYYMKCKIFNAYWKKSETSLIVDANSFCCNRYEAKGE